MIRVGLGLELGLRLRLVHLLLDRRGVAEVCILGVLSSYYYYYYYY